MNGTILCHLDDVGASHGSVVAWKRLRAAGIVRSASVMVPCPWYPLAVEDWREAPDQDLGVHITLTSEWAAYRWRPMTGPVAGLTDADGFFHRRPEAVAAAADPAAVADEMAAQIERALADGIRPSHLDAHMGTAYMGAFIEVFLDISARYAIPVMMCRDFAQLFGQVGIPPPDPGLVAEVMAEMERRGWPVHDRLLMGFCPPGADIAGHVDRLVGGAGPGRHWLALHANAPDDTPAFAPHMAEPRLREFEFFGTPAAAAPFDRHGFATVNWPEFAGG